MANASDYAKDKLKAFLEDTPKTYITLAKASEQFGIPKRTLHNACKAGHLKFEWRVTEVPYRVEYMVTTQQWLDEWKASDKKRTGRKTKTPSP